MSIYIPIRGRTQTQFSNVSLGHLVILLMKLQFPAFGPLSNLQHALGGNLNTAVASCFLMLISKIFYQMRATVGNTQHAENFG